ncbi:hypothetical protein L204_103509 [Cryptococcus depauperatus]
MCPTPDQPTTNTSDQVMVPVDITSPHVNTTSKDHTSNGTAVAQPPAVKSHRGLYGRASDFLSNTSNWKIIESTLREGEQFANAFFNLETKIKIAKICHMDDARLAVETGVDGVDVVIGTSSFLREHSHGKDMAWITKTFSSEDSFRSELVDLLSIYRTVDKIGVNRVGVADTVGCADPRQVYDLVRTLRGVVSCDIETHFHNDTGCAIANAYAALEAGATHVDTSILGIGERNGITPLGGLIARMMVADPDYVKSKYNLTMLRELENTVAEAVEVQVPFNNYITGFCAFTHKAGIHAKAILANPSTYEILNPADFGMTRYVSIGHRLTGWNAVKSRVEQLNLNLTDEQVKDATAKIKELADVRTQSMEDVDMILRIYHTGIHSGDLKVGQSAVLDKLLEKHMASRDSSPTSKSGHTDGIPAKRHKADKTSA